MRFNTVPLPYCRCCGAEVHRAIREVDGEKVETDPNFCRKCGYSFRHFVRVRGGGSHIRSVPDVEEAEINDFDDEPWFNILGNLNNLDVAIRNAVPQNYKDLPIEELRRQIVAALWKQYTGKYPYQTPEERAVWAERQAILDRLHEELMQRCIASGTPPPLPPMAVPLSWHDITLSRFVQDYHQVWLNGLTAHVTLTPKEIERRIPQLEKYGYKIEPCDCDKVKYVPDETHPHFLRRAEEN